MKGLAIPWQKPVVRSRLPPIKSFYLVPSRIGMKSQSDDDEKTWNGKNSAIFSIDQSSLMNRLLCKNHSPLQTVGPNAQARNLLGPC